jgi:hypothetical protein
MVVRVLPSDKAKTFEVREISGGSGSMITRANSVCSSVPIISWF